MMHDVRVAMQGILLLVGSLPFLSFAGLPAVCLEQREFCSYILLQTACRPQLCKDGDLSPDLTGLLGSVSGRPAGTIIGMVLLNYRSCIQIFTKYNTLLASAVVTLDADQS